MSRKGFPNTTRGAREGTMKRKRDRKKKPPGDTRWGWEFGQLWSSMHEMVEISSDRACAILGATLVDSGLEMILRHAFTATAEASKDDCDWLLNGGRAPLMSMGVRARLARAIGVIDDDMKNAILRLIEIRNTFAHESLPDPLTYDEINELMTTFPSKLRKLIHQSEAKLPGAKTPRTLLASVCFALHMRLIVRADEMYGERVPGERK
jgi:DNA-binding MltR family transcriptional regulator